MSQFNDGERTLNTYSKEIRAIKIFQCQKLLLLKSPQNTTKQHRILSDVYQAVRGIFK